MRRAITVLAAVCVMGVSGIAMAQNPEKEKAASKAAQEWLAIVDAGRYDLSWKQAAAYFKNAVTQEQWVGTVKAFRDPLGKCGMRIERGATYMTTLPGAPDGEYVIVQFDTTFENKKSSVESVTMSLEADGQWRVCGYFIR
ncbi:MAG: DUF4019 domain-containing protein [Candidatus Omnitrophica bacterium]|nr:DUF4019 domain-containing protein [Candidatus Omnitrophota bacterium]MDD5574408.1 DUF4019 domain-containing protein [Candidatus Omnitrophota bacterium]